MMNDKKKKEKEKQANKVMTITVTVMVLVMAATVALVSLFSRPEEPAGTGTGTQATDGTSAATGTAEAPVSGKAAQTLPADPETRPTAVDPSDGESGKPTDTGVSPMDKPTLTLTLPVAGVLQKGFYDKVLVWSTTMEDYRTHTGIDIGASLGDPVRAAADGTVTDVWLDPMMGQCMKLDHGNGNETIYRNLASEPAKGIGVGSSVLAGEVIASVGESAIIEIAQEPHLHFELTQNGTSVDPVAYLNAADAAALSGTENVTD